MTKKHNEKTSERGFELGLGGILKGLGDLVEKLGDLAKTGEQLSRTGEIHGPGKEVKGIYGFTVKVGLGDDRPRVEPFGNIRQDRESGHTVVQEVREPVVDVFEEEDHVLVVAEMPGVSAEDVNITVEDDLLTFSAERGDKKYRKEVLLPASSAKRKDRRSPAITGSWKSSARSVRNEEPGHGLGAHRSARSQAQSHRGVEQGCGAGDCPHGSGRSRQAPGRHWGPGRSHREAWNGLQGDARGGSGRWRYTTASSNHRPPSETMTSGRKPSDKRSSEKKKRRGRSLTSLPRPDAPLRSEILVYGWVFVDQDQVEFQHVHIWAPKYPERSLHVPVDS